MRNEGIIELTVANNERKGAISQCDMSHRSIGVTLSHHVITTSYIGLFVDFLTQGLPVLEIRFALKRDSVDFRDPIAF